MQQRLVSRESSVGEVMYDFQSAATLRSISTYDQARTQQPDCVNRCADLQELSVDLLRKSGYLYLQGDYANARNLSRISYQHAVPQIRVHILRFQSVLEYDLQDFEEGSRLARESLRELHEHGIDDITGQGLSTTLLAANEAFLGNLEESDFIWQQALGEVRLAEDAVSFFYYSYYRSEFSLYIVKDIPRAIESAGQAVAMAKLMKNDLLEGCARSNLGECYRSLGRVVDARREMGIAISIFSKNPHRHQENRTLERLTACYAMVSDTVEDYDC